MNVRTSIALREDDATSSSTSAPWTSARRTAPAGRLIEIPDGFTLISEDQPDELARIIREFVRDTP